MFSLSYTDGFTNNLRRSLPQNNVAFEEKLHRMTINSNNRENQSSRQSNKILPKLSVCGNTPDLKKGRGFNFLSMLMVSKKKHVDKVLITPKLSRTTMD